jgi:SAM-dependent methyltransferase
VSGLVDRFRYYRYRRLSDDDWLRALLDSVEGQSKLPMPGFPPAELQSAFVGQSNEHAVYEAWMFYKIMSDQEKKHGLEIGPRSHVLDFGCGWGRFARIFLRDVPASHIFCADTWDLALELCRRTRVPGRLVQLGTMPPSDLPSARFDLAFAYSVFSHLAPEAHLAWRTELARVVKPGGLVFITTQARWFLDDCRRYREHPDQISHAWHEKLSNSFVDYEASLGQYDTGEFLFAPDQAAAPPADQSTTVLVDNPPELGPKLGPNFEIPSSYFESTFYGDALVPSAYFESQWTEFELLDFIADRPACEQAIAVMRRK